MADKTKIASGCILPISRIRTIMKSSPEVSNISQESLFLITKATELFVEHLARKTMRSHKNKNAVEYGVLAQLVDDDEILQFLSDIIPPKMTVKEYKEWSVKQKKRGVDADDDDDKASGES